MAACYNVTNICIYIFINIIGEFPSKAFLLMVLQNWVKQKLLPTYQLYNVTYLIKITCINGRDKPNTAVKF